MRLERYAGKLARTVLRGPRRSDASRLLDYISGYKHSFFPSRPRLCVQGVLEVSQHPPCGLTRGHEFLDAVEPDRPHKNRRPGIVFNCGDSLSTPNVIPFIAH